MTLPDVEPRFVTVTSTGIFCRPDCPAPAPHPDHVVRMATAREALFAGCRPCLRCHPLQADGGAVTDAELRRAERLRPILAAARRVRRRRPRGRVVVVSLLATPLGAMLAGAIDEGICLLEFADRPMLPTQLETVRRRLGRPIVAGRHGHLDRLEAELGQYFAGGRRDFVVPVVAPGSPFQERTWAQLRTIPVGQTVSYEALARRVGRPGAQRAVGTANGANRVALVIPCHRVVRKSGETGNYGGGRWRKAWLLAHEQAMVAAT